METSSLDPERQKTALKYEEIQRRLTLIEWALTGILLLALVFGGLSKLIVLLFDFPQPLATMVYLVILGLAMTIITSPISYYGGFILPRRFGLSIQKLPSWIFDRLKAGIISLVIGLALFAFIYWAMEAFPQFWWLMTGIVVILGELLMTRFPTLLISLFYKVEPLKDADLENRLRQLAERTHTRISGVYTLNLSTKETTANAMLAGLGSTRRIIITDTLQQKYSPEEIEVVLAHELGHHILRHITNLILVQAFTVLLTFYFANLTLLYLGGLLGYRYLSDPAAFPFLLLIISVVSLVMTPVLNWYSRQLETNADKVAIHLTDNPRAFISMMTKLADQNLAVASPKRWVEIMFYDHPPVMKRIALARDYIQEREGKN